MILYSPSKGCLRSTFTVRTLWHQIFSWCYSTSFFKPVLEKAVVWILSGYGMSLYKDGGISTFDHNITFGSRIIDRQKYFITWTPHPKHVIEKYGQHTVPLAPFSDSNSASSACWASAMFSVAVLAETSLRSPRKLFIFTIEKYLYRIIVSKK